MIIVDGHEDLSYNTLRFGRDYTRPAAETRRLEAGTDVLKLNGEALLGYPDYRRGRVALVFGTLFGAPKRTMPALDKLVYETPAQAYEIYRRQVDVYEELAGHHPEMFRLVLAQNDLQEVLEKWQALGPAVPRKRAVPGSEAARNGDENAEGRLTESGEADSEFAGPPVGLVMLMEGAEGVREAGELETWWRLGIRIIGPAWVGTRFCGGTNEPGPLTQEGFALLEGMDEVGFALDISHMDEKAVLQALDVFPGPCLASHSNAARRIQGLGDDPSTNRHLSDLVVRRLLERDGIIGIVPVNAFLLHGWKKGDRRDAVSLDFVVAQIDHICQMAGDARHVGLGTDFEGGFGRESIPAELDTIADLQKLAPLLAERGYSQADVAAIMGENWISLLRKVLPESL